LLKSLEVMGLEFIWDLEFGFWNLPPLRPRFGVIKSGNPRGIKEKSAKYSSRGTRKLASGGKRYYNR
jgi:hypothetical protein